MANEFDVIVIGGGPAGYVAAIRSAQLGMNTALVDDFIGKQGKPVLGGTCANVGCIPSKALLESTEAYENIVKSSKIHGISVNEVTVDVAAMVTRKDKIVASMSTGVEQLLKANKVTWLKGRGRLLPEKQVEVTDHKGKVKTHQSENVIFATGSSPVEIPSAPLTDDIIVNSSGALDWDSAPERLGVIGAGVIGLELGTVWRRLGSEVTLLEAQDIFLPMADREIGKEALRQFSSQGLDIRLSARVTSSIVEKGVVNLTYSDPEGEHTLTVDRLIVCVGRRPCSENIAAPETDLLIDEGGFIHVDENCETNLPGVYAIGDVVRGPMLAHKGSEEGIVVAERIAGNHAHVNYDAIPSVIYTHPEISWVGKTEEELKASGEDYSAGVFPFAASGRARAMNDANGMVKVLINNQTDRILGVHIIGPQSSEIIGQAVMALEFEGTSEDIASTVFAHPTLSEAFHEAALGADGRAIHIVNKKRR
ncbi:MAG TPA: dihydrolipoyl dehydrogenase [Gammaproteobacteria bacterium]|nr:dihydrolipoyl dehydrogenase [Gammaproteobacteria bacterium]